MKLPEAFLNSMRDVPGFQYEPFVAIHESGEQVTSIRLNASKLPVDSNAEIFLSSQPSWSPSTQLSNVPWCESGRYISQRPSFTFDPLFHAGCYYVQEASSMFLEQAFRQLLSLDEPLKVLDLCAAPGGKSTHMQSLLSKESLLVSNEVIKPRAVVLTDNIIKWGSPNVIVTNNDPKAFAAVPEYFDVMVVDAPCSGSGLFRKDKDAISEWSPAAVGLCCQRQRRILADAMPALKEGGVLIYSTCSYSPQEDEAIADWLMDDMKMESLELSTSAYTGIVGSGSAVTGAEGYRFYPDRIKGEGFFMTCFRKTQSSGTAKLQSKKIETVSIKERSVLADWVQADGNVFLREGEEVSLMPPHVIEAFAELRTVLSVQYAGTKGGTFLRDKFIPHHALAQSLLLSPKVPSTKLTYDEAILYLQRQDLKLKPERPGWQTVRYAGQHLGWINALPARINNYYPKELRILKARNDTGFPNL